MTRQQVIPRAGVKFCLTLSWGFSRTRNGQPGTWKGSKVKPAKGFVNMLTGLATVPRIGLPRTKPAKHAPKRTALIFWFP